MQTHTKRATLRVRDVVDIDQSRAVIIPNSTPFEEVVRAFAQRGDLRGIFVVDAQEHLTGVITRQDLLHWAAERLRVPDPRGQDWRDVYRVMTASTAKQACRKRSAECAVRLDDPLERVLAKMFENELIDVPVVDEQGHIVGDVRLTEILRKVIETKGA